MYFLGEFVWLQGNDISLGVQFHCSKKFLDPACRASSLLVNMPFLLIELDLCDIELWNLGKGAWCDSKYGQGRKAHQGPAVTIISSMVLCATIGIVLFMVCWDGGTPALHWPVPYLGRPPCMNLAAAATTKTLGWNSKCGAQRARTNVRTGRNAKANKVRAWGDGILLSKRGVRGKDPGSRAARQSARETLGRQEIYRLLAADRACLDH